MVARRFTAGKPVVPTLLSETGHRHETSPTAAVTAAAQPPEPSGQSPPPSLPLSTPASPSSSPAGPPRILSNAERIARDRQTITDSGVLPIMLDHLFGRVQLTPSQVSTGFGLLKKVLPDFSNSAPPQDDDKRDDDDDYGDGHGNAPEDPEFEVYIVDP